MKSFPRILRDRLPAEAWEALSKSSFDQCHFNSFIVMSDKIAHVAQAFEVCFLESFQDVKGIFVF